MRCANCGTELPTVANYCPSCGANCWLGGAAGAGEAAATARPIGEPAWTAARAALATPKGKSIAAHAAIGAVVAVPLPVIGPLAGALVGGAVGWWRSRGID